MAHEMIALIGAILLICVTTAAWAQSTGGPATGPAAAENLVANGLFAQGEVGKLPTGWTVKAANPALAPVFKLVQDEKGKALLMAQGNGRNECFGSIEYPVKLEANKTYCLRVRFRLEGFDDVNRHLVHGLFGAGFNNGVLEYRRDGQWIVGESRFTGPTQAIAANVRLYFRYAPKGKVWWDEVSLSECKAIPPRKVKIAVSGGAGTMAHWGQVLDAAGAKGCDVALLPEMFEGNHDPLKAEAVDGPSMKFLSDKAKQHKMYVSGSLYLKRGDVVYNTAPLFDRQGKCVGMYDKNMLYDPEVDLGATSGTELPVFDTDFGKLGIMICYDSWHPSVAKLLALKGAELILFPSAGYYRQLMHARAADNCVVIAASSEGNPLGLWDSSGTEAGEEKPDPSRYAASNIKDVDKDDKLKILIATVDLSAKPSPHNWGGPMMSAPGGRRVRSTSPLYIEDEIAREVRRWDAAPSRAPITKR